MAAPRPPSCPEQHSRPWRSPRRPQRWLRLRHARTARRWRTCQRRPRWPGPRTNRGLADDDVQLVAHAAGPGQVGHAAGPVEIAVQDVVHHAARVPDLEAARARLDPTHNGRADDGHLLAVGHLDQLPGVVLRNTLGDDSDPGCGHSWSCISPPLSSGGS